MKSTEILMREHDIIKRAINLLEIVDDRLAAGDDAVVSVYPELVDFIKSFADECHHGKEEDILFELLEERGVPRENSPLAVMMDEHETGRRFVRNIERSANQFIHGDKAVRVQIIQNSESYARLLKDHIYKEDAVLYPMADKILSEADQQRLDEEFSRVEADFGPERHRHYEQMIADLEQEYL